MLSKENNPFLDEIKKRPLEKPLSLNELSSLRMLTHHELESNPKCLELLVEYCKISNFLHHSIDSSNYHS